MGIQEIIIFLATLKTEIEILRNGQYSGQATFTNKVNDARDVAHFDFIKLVHLKNVRNKKIIFFLKFLAYLMTGIEMVSFVVKRH